MTKETLKRATELDRAIGKAGEWLEEILQAEILYREEKNTGYFSLEIKTCSGSRISVQIPANAARNAIEGTKAEIIKEIKRMESIFEGLH